MAAKIEATLDAIKDLLRKIPNLPELIEEARKEPPTVIAETAYIYNGYGCDQTLMHLGIEYPCRANEVTTIYGMPDYKEIDQARSRPDAIEWFNLPMRGETIAHELVTKQEFNKLGFTVFTKLEWNEELQIDTVPVHIKARADELGRMYWTNKIEQFKVNRKKAEAGYAGFKSSPDPNLYQMMKLYSPDDVHFTQASNKRIDELVDRQLNSGDQLAKAVAMIADLLGALSGKRSENITINMAPPTVSEAEPYVPSISERAKAMGINRRPHEKDTVYEVRIVEAEKRKARVDAEAAQLLADEQARASMEAADTEEEMIQTEE